ncbi:hypothetical protein T4B_7676 [Trichinella pseudospiralis]|uniref:Secreted protein n=1 Tax=Trichinella pseudospiralis TaxID=6337 RepID=A0A0V1IDS6_TRIPS|nr:hypothetical protein T4B_7676 [Trichinella pseudospiralis]
MRHLIMMWCFVFYIMFFVMRGVAKPNVAHCNCTFLADRTFENKRACLARMCKIYERASSVYYFISAFDRLIRGCGGLQLKNAR